MGRRNKRRKTKRNQSSKQIPTDIVCDILVRLPVKSLLRFKIVCKHWCSIISDPSFAETYSSHSQTRPGAIPLLISLTKFTFLGPFFLSCDSSEGIACSVHHLNQSGLAIRGVSGYLNGLICLENLHQIYVCNLSTREIIALPPTGAESALDSMGKQFSFSSFGYSPLTKEYKVLKTWLESDPENAVVTRHKVLTLGTKVWRSIDGCHIDFLREGCVCVNGVLHFSTMDCSNTIVAFDVGSEKFSTIPLPDGAFSLGYKSTMIQLKGLLAVVDYNHLVDHNVMTIWTLNDYQNQVWTEQSISLPIYWNKVRENYESFLVGSIRTGELLLIPRVFSKHLHIFYYAIEEGTLKTVKISGLPEDMMWSPSFVDIAPIDYVESILSLRRINS